MTLLQSGLPACSTYAFAEVRPQRADQPLKASFIGIPQRLDSRGIIRLLTIRDHHQRHR